MSASARLEEELRLRRAEDAWLDQSAERLRRASRHPGPGSGARGSEAAVPATNEEDER